MPQTARIWRVQDNGALAEVESSALDAEERLEDWLADDISILQEDLLVIGRQVETDFGGALDLLCIDPTGDLVVVELKRDKTPRQVVAQALDYASWGVDLSSTNIEDQVQEHLDKPLENAFREAFNTPLPDVLNESHKILIVGAQIDAHSERIIEYLSDAHGVNINAATFQYFEDENVGQLLSRVFLIEPSKVETRTSRKGTSKRKPDLTRSELKERAASRGSVSGTGPLSRNWPPFLRRPRRRGLPFRLRPTFGTPGSTCKPVRSLAFGRTRLSGLMPTKIETTDCTFRCTPIVSRLVSAFRRTQFATSFRTTRMSGPTPGTEGTKVCPASMGFSRRTRK